MPLLKRKRVLAAKIETTVGTPISLAAADGVFDVFDAEIQPTIDFHERPGQSAFSPQTGRTGARGGRLTFKTDLVPGSGAHPAWATTFLPACGLVASTDTYAPVTAPPGSSGVKTLTMGVYENGLLKSIKGAMGKPKFIFESGKPAMIEWEFLGVWVPPTDVAILAPTYPTLLPLRYMSVVQTIGAWAFKAQKVEIDIGNDLQLREDASDANGFISAIITNRRITGTLNPESELVADKNYHNEWIADTEQALSIALAESNLGFTFTAPKLQFTNITEADRNGIQTDDLEFQLNRSAAAGDDEFTLLVDHSVV